MTDAQAKSLPSPEYFFATPYFFLLSKKRADTRMLIEEIDFLLSGPFNVETVRTYLVLEKTKYLKMPVWNFHASNVADRSDRKVSNTPMHAAIKFAYIRLFF